MTFRTFDIDAGTATATDFDPAERISRRSRLRRNSTVLGRRTSGSRLSGFGI